MNKQIELLRALPAVDQVLQLDAVKPLRDSVLPQVLTQWIRTAVDGVRQEIQTGQRQEIADIESAVLSKIQNTAAFDEGSRLQSVINATGILLHTNLGRSPIAPIAMDRMQAAASYANVELNLQTGKRSGRGDRAIRLLAELCGAEDALVVNNCAAATLLTLQTLAAGHEVIVSRGQLVEIGGGYRLPEVFAASGAVLKEVGTTNRTYVRDYSRAVGDSTAAMIRVHRSNFHQLGFVTEPSINELTTLRDTDHQNLLVIDDLGSGCMHRLNKYGLDEPTVGDSMAAGADVALFSGDKLFGGPQAGIIVGRQTIVQRLRRSPLMRALRVDKMTLAGIEATAELHFNGQAETQIPLLRMLSESAADDHEKAESLVQQISAQSSYLSIVDDVAQVGGGSVPGSEIASCAVAVQCANVEAFNHALRTKQQPILARIQDGAVLLNLRTIPKEQITAAATTIRMALAEQNIGKTR